VMINTNLTFLSSVGGLSSDSKKSNSLSTITITSSGLEPVTFRAGNTNCCIQEKIIMQLISVIYTNDNVYKQTLSFTCSKSSTLINYYELKSYYVLKMVFKLNDLLFI
jgi:hypothetical protein